MPTGKLYISSKKRATMCYKLEEHASTSLTKKCYQHQLEQSDHGLLNDISRIGNEDLRSLK